MLRFHIGQNPPLYGRAHGRGPQPPGMITLSTGNVSRAVVLKSLSVRYLVQSADNRLREVLDTLCSELHCNRHMARSHRVRKGFEASCPVAKMQLKSSYGSPCLTRQQNYWSRVAP